MLQCAYRYDSSRTVWKNSIAVVQTAGAPPTSGSRKRANIGWTRKTSPALSDEREREQRHHPARRRVAPRSTSGARERSPCRADGRHCGRCRLGARRLGNAEAPARAEPRPVGAEHRHERQRREPGDVEEQPVLGAELERDHDRARQRRDLARVTAPRDEGEGHAERHREHLEGRLQAAERRMQAPQAERRRARDLVAERVVPQLAQAAVGDGHVRARPGRRPRTRPRSGRATRARRSPVPTANSGASAAGKNLAAVARPSSSAAAERASAGPAARRPSASPPARRWCSTGARRPSTGTPPRRTRARSRACGPRARRAAAAEQQQADHRQQVERDAPPRERRAGRPRPRARGRSARTGRRRGTSTGP